jgi:hypothetical protein
LSPCPIRRAAEDVFTELYSDEVITEKVIDWPRSTYARDQKHAQDFNLKNMLERDLFQNLGRERRIIFESALKEFWGICKLDNLAYGRFPSEAGIS